MNIKLTFREKSLWLTLLSLIVVFGLYFAAVLPSNQINIAPQQIMISVGMLILLVVIQIIGHIVLAIANQRELSAKVQKDERDVLINLKSTRLANYVFHTGVFCSLGIALLVPGNFVFVNVLLAFWVAAQVVEIISQLTLYRRGI
jgi:uncharacterized membrane protein HdeD (DUF308 family)